MHSDSWQSVSAKSSWISLYTKEEVSYTQKEVQDPRASVIWVIVVVKGRNVTMLDWLKGQVSALLSC